jgi:hypothetical protein
MSDVEISAETAMVALRELNILISQTGGDDGHEMVGEVEGTTCAMTPLALARHRIEQLESERIDEFTLKQVQQVLGGVAEQTGVELGAVDPLQDDVFQARDGLAASLGGEN